MIAKLIDLIGKTIEVKDVIMDTKCIDGKKIDTGFDIIFIENNSEYILNITPYPDYDGIVDIDESIDLHTTKLISKTQ